MLWSIFFLQPWYRCTEWCLLQPTVNIVVLLSQAFPINYVVISGKQSFIFLNKVISSPRGESGGNEMYGCIVQSENSWFKVCCSFSIRIIAPWIGSHQICIGVMLGRRRGLNDRQEEVLQLVTRHKRNSLNTEWILTLLAFGRGIWAKSKRNEQQRGGKKATKLSANQRLSCYFCWKL